MRIKNIALSCGVAALAWCAFASASALAPITEAGRGEAGVLLECDTVMNVGGYSVHIIREDGEETFAGLNLFSEEMKESFDRDLLGRIETDLYKMALRKPGAEEAVTRIVKGKAADFKAITPQTPCSVNSDNARSLAVAWTVNGKRVEVALPVSYETAGAGNRSETENLLIKKIRESDGKRKAFKIATDDLEPYGESLYVLPGGSYLSKDVTRNVYPDSALNPVWDSAYPRESLANLFIFPSDRYGEVMMEVTVLKHEYGEKEQLTVPVASLLAAMENEGCTPYWGVEKMEDGTLEGALFLFNSRRGYDHVLRIECRPEEVIGGKGTIKGRASLYIPTNNVDNLNAPYIEKSEDEKIKY